MKSIMFWAKERVIRKSSTAEEVKDSKMKGLYFFVASHNQPQRKDANMEQKVATDAITPKATRGPPMMLASWKPTT